MKDFVVFLDMKCFDSAALNSNKFCNDSFQRRQIVFIYFLYKREYKIKYNLNITLFFQQLKAFSYSKNIILCKFDTTES